MPLQSFFIHHPRTNIEYLTMEEMRSEPRTDKIDTHHHFVPDFYAQGDPSGWPTPKWSPAASESIMEQLGVKTTILSLTAPGACILEGQKSFDLARRCNEYCSELRDKSPRKWGFFAALPSLLNTEAALAEIAYALDVLHADGVTLFTRYGTGNTYLGHADIEPIWKELDRRQAVVFVHPTHPVDTTKVNESMPQPLIDYPHETTRTATDMIIAGTRRKYPDCKVILSHAGGALPYLIGRISNGSQHGQKAMADFKSFYYDLALSSSPSVLQLLLTMSDFPYAPPPSIKAFAEKLENFEMDSKLRSKIHYGNALALLPRLAEKANF
ncbi:amidohydrolase family protein [Aureobasidium pullulans]|uniref:6-methylsalicylate decarboxylase n=1 Tax=Aureobasidium pullulans TaxID=5580 RepID=A0A4S8SHP9_AURPU|nr:amidohydrolase family protein [Aureobasidium pullulans]